MLYHNGTVICVIGLKRCNKVVFSILNFARFMTISKKQGGGMKKMYHTAIRTSGGIEAKRCGFRPGSFQNGEYAERFLATVTSNGLVG